MQDRKRYKHLVLAGAVFCAGLLTTYELRAEKSARQIPTEQLQVSPLGDYLVGRFAGSNRDMEGAAERFIRAVRKDPGDIRLLRQTFSLAVVVGRHEDAVWIARQLIDLEDGKTGLMELVLAIEEIRAGDQKAARAIVDNMGLTGLNSLMVPLLSAWLHGAEGEFDEALTALDGLKESSGYTPFMNMHRALLLDMADRRDEARAAYDLMVFDPSTADLRVVQAYGRFLERTGDRKEAKKLFESFLAHHESNPMLAADIDALERGKLSDRLIENTKQGISDALFSTGQALARQRSIPAGIIYLRLARTLTPEFAGASLLLANLLETDNQYESAAGVYDDAVGDPVLGWTARYKKAMILARLDDTEEAISMLERMVKDRSDDLPIASALAELLRSEERYDDARKQYDKVIGQVEKLEARHWPLLYARGISLERLGEWQSAEADFLSALELNPDEPLVLNYLGYTWVDQGVNLDRALGMIEKAVEQRPEDGYMIDSLGWALYRLGQYEEAAAWLEKAVGLKPEDPTINDHLGDAYWRIGRRLEAKFQWRHAIAMGPEDEDLAKIRAKIVDGMPTGQAQNR